MLMSATPSASTIANNACADSPPPASMDRPSSGEDESLVSGLVIEKERHALVAEASAFDSMFLQTGL